MENKSKEENRNLQRPKAKDHLELMSENLKTTWANKAVFFLLCTTIVWTTLAYGTVHQPFIALFYLVVTLIIIFWAIDAFASRALRFDKSLLQFPILAVSVYALVQAFSSGVLRFNKSLIQIPLIAAFRLRAYFKLFRSAVWRKSAACRAFRERFRSIRFGQRFSRFIFSPV